MKYLPPRKVMIDMWTFSGEHWAHVLRRAGHRWNKSEGQPIADRVVIYDFEQVKGVELPAYVDDIKR